MPLGGQSYPMPDGTPQIVPVGPRQMAPAAPSLEERQAGSQIWHHETIGTTDWDNGTYIVDFPGEVTKITVHAPASTPLWLGLDTSVGSNPGTYDIAHPGGGFLTDNVRPIKRLFITTGTGLAPTAPVEVYGKGGSYALLP